MIVANKLARGTFPKAKKILGRFGDFLIGRLIGWITKEVQTSLNASCPSAEFKSPLGNSVFGTMNRGGN